ncbi:MAG: CopG family transcriptional regulator [Sulfolobales archaeon]
MSTVFSVKLRREIREKMDKYRDRINWAEEVRRFIEETIKRLEARENLEKIVRELENATWSVPRGFAEESVREDRESR